MVRQAISADPTESLDITENELIQALAEAQPVIDEDREGFLTAREMVQALGWSAWTVKAHLRALHDQGRIETRKVPVLDIAGRMTRVPAYRLKT